MTAESVDLDGVDSRASLDRRQRRRRDPRLAVATSSRIGRAAGHLRRLGLLDRFVAACTRDDLERVKPNPELCPLGCEQLGVAPKRVWRSRDFADGVGAGGRRGVHRRCA